MARGDITSEKEDDGREFYYMAQRQKGRREALQHIRESTGVQNDAKGAKAWDWSEWAKFSGQKLSAGSSGDAITDGKTAEQPLALSQRLQESYDSTTRLVLDCQRTAQLLTALNNDGRKSDNVRSMIMKGVAMVKELNGPTQAIAEMLCQEPSLLDAAAVRKLLLEAAGPFQRLQKHHQECYPFIKLLKDEQRKDQDAEKPEKKEKRQKTK